MKSDGRSVVLGVVLALFSLPAWAAWDGARGPHDEAHLVVLWADGFRDANGAAIRPAADPAAEGGAALPLAAHAACHTFAVRYAGDYVVWVRLAYAEGARLPVAVTMSRDGRSVAAATVLDGPGAAGAGGPAGLAAYLKEALRGPGDAKTIAASKGYAVDGPETPAGRSDGAADPAPAPGPVPGVTIEVPGQRQHPFVSASRLDALRDPRWPLLWWKAFRAKLDAGTYTLALHLPAAPPGRPPVLDLAFLSTAADAGLPYPYAGDFTHRPGSYLRFRLDKLPAACGGVAIKASARTHANPFGAGPWLFNPDGLGAEKAGPVKHTQAGFTRWYRLQDGGGPGSPPYGAASFTLNLDVSDAAQAAGATQFAAWPHPDGVLREIDWHAPCGLELSLRADWDRFPEAIRTIQDHARLHYEWALEGAEERVFPLTPTDVLLFSNSAGGVPAGPAQDYAFKTIRLMGVNVPAVSDGLVYRRLYGGDLSGAHYWPQTRLPFDEQATRSLYEKDYEKTFQDPAARGWVVFQNADEPGEINRTEMSAPLWVYHAAADGGREQWTDVSGNSELQTRRNDYRDCVLEGQVARKAGTVGFRVATPGPGTAGTFGYWRVGVLHGERPENVAVMKPGATAEAWLLRPGATVGTTPTAFKIVYESGQSGTATLYVGGKLVSQMDGLAKQGGFALFGSPKTVTALAIRPIRKGESAVARQPGGEVADPALGEPLAEPGDGPTPAAGGKPKTLKAFVEEDWAVGGGMAAAHEGFRLWAAGQGLEPGLFGCKAWSDVRMLALVCQARTPEEKRLYYWSRRYSGWLTPKMFALASDGMRKHAANPGMRSFVALSGHALYFNTEMPLDMFELARLGRSNGMMPGVSDAMALGGPGSWRWDSEHAVAYSVAPYNAGLRQYGSAPTNFPMMHCDWPRDVRSHVMLANQVKYISYFWWGPEYAITEWHWSESPSSYGAVCRTDNRASQVADLLGPGWMRPSRVALLYAHATEYWSGPDSYADKRALFLALAHEYYQPDLITEQQVRDGELKHYDALYVTEPHVDSAAQDRIADWVRAGGLLWSCANALRFDQDDQPADLLDRLIALKRQFPAAGQPAASAPPAPPSARPLVMSPVPGQADFLPHATYPAPPTKIDCDGVRVRAVYDDGRPAWLEKPAGKGRVTYVGHRGGLTYSRNALVVAGFQDQWLDAARVPLAAMLHEAKVDRQLVLSEPCVAAYPVGTDQGTVVPIANLRAYPIDNLEVRLREPAKPAGVQWFQGVRLVDLAFDYADGYVRTVLPRLAFDGTTMLVVRRTPPPKDDRPADLRKHAEALLAAATDWQALSAGAWLAGFRPDWGLAARIVPLLTHAQPEVRRAAAEALGRLRHAPATSALQAALRAEQDPHALAEMLLALARLAPAECLPTCVEMASHRQIMVRRGALTALAMLLRQARQAGGEPSPDLASAAGQAAGPALADPDARAFLPALEIHAALDPAGALDLAAQALRGQGPGAARADLWVDTVARSDAVAAEFVRQGCAGDVRILQALAAHHQHPALAKALAADPARLSGPGAWRAILNVAEPSAARALFAARDRLPLQPQARPIVLTLLERVFHAHLGADDKAWGAWLGQHPHKP